MSPEGAGPLELSELPMSWHFVSNMNVKRVAEAQIYPSHSFEQRQHPIFCHFSSTSALGGTSA